jgi:hypothetical protein
MSTGINEHIKKIEEIKQHINNSKGNQRRQYIKCLHRLQKELNLYNILKR